jgi:ribosomal protein S6--L-glutamate ligase|tara:strand:- start:4 stop:1449 length:1446 start_codon:yes stop_codon:yes gene_type:complete
MKKLRELKKSIKVNTSFEKFLTEATTTPDEKYKVVVLSGKPEQDDKEYYHTAGRIKEEAEKLGHQVYVVYSDGAYIQWKDDVRTIHNSDDKKGFDITNTDTIVFVRESVRFKESWLDLISQLEKTSISRGHGLCLVNDRECVETCSDKYRTYVRLSDFGITQPKTILIPNQYNIEKAIDTLDKKYPIILKTLKGSKGVGVMYIESERSLAAVIQLLYQQDEYADLLIQEYIKTDYDVRVMVLDGKVLGAMRRDVATGDFRSNFSRGGKPSKFKLTDLEEEQTILAAKAVNGLWTAVDFIPSKDRKKLPPYILEVNYSPGTEGIEETLKKNIVKEVLQHFRKRRTRRRVPTQVGFFEVVKIKPFGDLVAKFDTGNNAKPVIHADPDDLKVDGDKVTFTCKGHTSTTKIVGKYTTVTGGGKETRLFVKLDLNFLGHKYKDIEFGLDDRSDVTGHVLLGRDIMQVLNVMVNPDRKYVVTTKKTL